MSPQLHDQGVFNYLIFSGILNTTNITIYKFPPEMEMVRHSARSFITGSFPNIKSLYNDNLTSLVLHHYYNSNVKFKKSLLIQCPRLTKDEIQYLPHVDNNQIIQYEEEIHNNYFK